MRSGGGAGRDHGESPAKHLLAVIDFRNTCSATVIIVSQQDLPAIPCLIEPNPLSRRQKSHLNLYSAFRVHQPEVCSSTVSKYHRSTCQIHVLQASLPSQQLQLTRPYLLDLLQQQVPLPRTDLQRFQLGPTLPQYQAPRDTTVLLPILPEASWVLHSSHDP